MELQLGLALPTTRSSPRGFDLNSLGFEQEEMVSSDTWNGGASLDSENYKIKRGYEAAFGDMRHDRSSRMVGLLLWNGQPNEEDDRKGQRKSSDSSSINKNDEEESQVVVGWPPIKSWRKKLLPHHHQGVCRVGDNRMAMATRENNGSNSMYVKVKMEGVAITRKIDLKLYHSYQTLNNSLISMFPKYQKGYQDAANYVLTYQDKEGDWLLAGDVPWQTFVESVQRLEILKNGIRSG